jgi:hypothetical protein
MDGQSHPKRVDRDNSGESHEMRKCNFGYHSVSILLSRHGFLLPIL